MVSYEYRAAFSETLDILSHTRKEDIEKIPDKFLEFLKNNKLNSYESKIDYEKSILDMNLSQKTIGILSIIYKKYWCDEKGRKIFEEKLKQNETLYQKQLSNKYDTDKLFKNKVENEVENKVENKVEKTNITDITEYKKQSWYKKIFKRIYSFFLKNK